MTENKNQFIGVWKLVSIETKDGNGKILTDIAGPLGHKPEGVAIFTKEHMYCQMMNPDRPKIVNTGNSEEIVSAYSGYYAYGGLYDVNEKDQKVTYHVAMGLDPAMIGRDEVRSYSFSGDMLILVPPPIVFGDQTFHPSLSWERAE